MPEAIQIVPAIFAGWLRLSQSSRQITKPRTGGRSKRRRPFLITNYVTHECGGIHAHEGDERAEIEHLGAEAVAHDECADEGDGSDEEYVVARDAMLGVDRAEKRFWQRVAAAHAVEQTGRADLRAHA